MMLLVVFRLCAAYLECNYAHAHSVGMPSIEALYDFTFLDQSEASWKSVEVHVHLVACYAGPHFKAVCGVDPLPATRLPSNRFRTLALSIFSSPQDGPHSWLIACGQDLFTCSPIF